MKYFVRLWLLLMGGVLFAQNSHTAAADPFTREHFTKKEVYITMRDGVKLFTAIYTPKDISKNKKYPFIMQRTCYGIAPYGESKYRNALGPNQF